MKIYLTKMPDASYLVIVGSQFEEKEEGKKPALTFTDNSYNCQVGGTVLGMTYEELEQMGEGGHEVDPALLDPGRLLADKADLMADILGGAAGADALTAIRKVTDEKKKKRKGK